MTEVGYSQHTEVEMAFQSRQKGAAGERELAEVLRSMGYQARRSQQYCGAEATSDLLVEEMPGILVECKRVERLNIDTAMSKAVSDAAPADKLPAVFHRKNGGSWMVTIRLADLHAFVEQVAAAMGRRTHG